MYRILCYGDSNTWGYNAETGDRFPEDVRWTGVLQGLLGPAVRILEEGGIQNVVIEPNLILRTSTAR